MAYLAEKAELVSMLPPDSILDGRVIEIADGKVQDFVQNHESWKGELTQPCINVIVEIKNQGNTQKIPQVFTYNQSGDKSQYTARSNMGKYSKKYGHPPKLGDIVKIATNAEGFGK